MQRALYVILLILEQIEAVVFENFYFAEMIEFNQI